MEQRQRKRYTEEYKIDVVRMIEEHQSRISEVAKDMGVRVDLLYAWKRKYGNQQPKPINPGISAEVKRLQKRLSEVEEERDILKKAVAIFTQRPKGGTNS